MYTIETRYRSCSCRTLERQTNCGKHRGERSAFTGERGDAVFYRGRAQVEDEATRDWLVGYFGYADVTPEVEASARGEVAASYAPALSRRGTLPK